MPRDPNRNSPNIEIEHGSPVFVFADASLVFDFLVVDLEEEELFLVELLEEPDFEEFCNLAA